jgi:hypothetical protein
MEDKEIYSSKEVGKISDLTAECKERYKSEFDDMFNALIYYVKEKYDKKTFILALNSISYSQSKNLEKYQKGVPENVRKNSELEGRINELIKINP